MLWLLSDLYTTVPDKRRRMKPDGDHRDATLTLTLTDCGYHQNRAMLHWRVLVRNDVVSMTCP